MHTRHVAGGIIAAAFLSLTPTQTSATDAERAFFDGIQARNVGPFRGGRATVAEGVQQDPHTYYMGTTGGVWKTTNAGGLYRSDDGGETWTQVNSDRLLIARSWYYMHVFADPVDADTVYVLNAPFLKSVDGGAHFSRISVPHGDNHDLWITHVTPRGW